MTLFWDPGVLGGVLAPVKEQGKKGGVFRGTDIEREISYELSFSGTGDNPTLFDWRKIRPLEYRRNSTP